MLSSSQNHRYLAFDAAAHELGLVPLWTEWVDPVTGIASVEAFGTAKLVENVSPSGIASAQAFGTAKATLGIACTGITSAGAFGTAAVVEKVSPSGIASAEAFGSDRLTQILAAAGIASAEAFGVASLGSVTTISGAGGIASAQAFGTPSLPKVLGPTGIASAESFGSTTVTRSLDFILIADGESAAIPLVTTGESAAFPLIFGLDGGDFDLGTLQQDRTVAPFGIASAEAFGTPSLIADVLRPTGIPSEEAFGTPSFTISQQVVLEGNGIPSAETFGTAALVVQGTIRPTGIPSAQAFGTPSVGTPTALIAAQGIPSAEAFGDTIVALTGQIVVPGIASAQAIGIPLVSLGPAARPDGIASAQAFGTALVAVSGTPLLDYAIGNFNRTTGASAYWDATDFDYFPADVLRTENRADGAGDVCIFERLRVNNLRGTTNLAGTAWVLASGATTGGAITGPDGDSSSGLILNFTANANSQTSQTISTTVLGDNTVQTFSIYAKIASGSNGRMRLVVQKKDFTSAELVITTLSTTWQRFDFTLNCGTGGGPVVFRIQNHSDAVARTIHVSSPQADSGNYPTSYIQNADQSNPTLNGEDVWLGLPAQVAGYLRGGAWQLTVYPKWANTDLSSGAVRILADFGGSGNDLRFRHDGTGVLLEARVGGVTVAQSGYITVSRLAALTVKVNPSAAVITVAGVDGAAGTTWAWPGDVLIRWCGPVGSSGNEFDGRTSVPLAA